MTVSVYAGIDMLLAEHLSLLRDRAVGLVTNQTGVTQNLYGDALALQATLGSGLRALFGPEHGLHGYVQDRERIGHAVDPDTGLPVYSLYGAQEAPPDTILHDLDVLVFDIQDVGVRFYTYLTSMLYTMRAVAAHGVSLIVLDRPNPITGIRVTGPRLTPAYASFEGACHIPIRHGMTLGELARFLNTSERIGADLQVVPVAGWRRSMWYEDTGLPWIPPSPNMPTIDTAAVYPGMCLFEGTNVSEGRGTTRPFEMITAPWIESRRFADALNDAGLPGVRFRPAHVLPTFWKYQGILCHGVQVHVLNRQTCEPLLTALTMLACLQRLWPTHFAWQRLDASAPYFIDTLCGTEAVRLALDAGIPAADIIDGWRTDEQRFIEESRPFWLYEQ